MSTTKNSNTAFLFDDTDFIEPQAFWDPQKALSKPVGRPDEFCEHGFIENKTPKLYDKVLVGKYEFNEIKIRNEYDYKLKQKYFEIPSTPVVYWGQTFWREWQKATGRGPTWDEIEEEQWVESSNFPDNPDYSIFAGE